MARKGYEKNITPIGKSDSPKDKIEETPGLIKPTKGSICPIIGMMTTQRQYSDMRAASPVIEVSQTPVVCQKELCRWWIGVLDEDDLERSSDCVIRVFGRTAFLLFDYLDHMNRSLGIYEDEQSEDDDDDNDDGDSGKDTSPKTPELVPVGPEVEGE